MPGTEHQLRIRAVLEDFDKLRGALKEIQKSINELQSTTSKYGLGRTFEQAISEAKKYESELKNIISSLSELESREFRALKRGGEPRHFSQVFSKAEMPLFERLVSTSLKEAQELSTSKFIKTPFPLTTSPNIYTEYWGETFGEFLRKKSQEIQKAEEGYKQAKEWLKLNKDVVEANKGLKTAVEEQMKAWDMQRHGLEGNKLSLRNYSASLAILKRDIADLAAWQLRWYGTKFGMFLPMEFTGRAIRDQLEVNAAIQRTGAVADMTAEQMEKMRKAAVDISKTVPISAKEIAQASLTFGQAGMPFDAIMQSLPLAAKMVVATGEDMKYAVDALTIAFFAWKLEAKDMPQVADMIAAAMNASRLKVQDLATVFNYLATTANVLNRSVSSLTSIKDTLTLASVLSQAGVAPSTIGTGLSNAIIRLTRLAPALREALGRSNIRIEDVDPTRNRLLDVFKRLASAPELTLEQVFKGWEIRGGRTVSAIINQAVQALEDMEATISEKGVLERMFAKSTKSVLAELKLLENKFQAIFSIDKSSEESVRKLIASLGMLLDVVEMLKGPIAWFLATLAGFKIFKFLSREISQLGEAIKKLGDKIAWLPSVFGAIKPLVIPVTILFVIKGVFDKIEEQRRLSIREAIEQGDTAYKEALFSAINKRINALQEHKLKVQEGKAFGFSVEVPFTEREKEAIRRFAEGGKKKGAGIDIRSLDIEELQKISRIFEGVADKEEAAFNERLSKMSEEVKKKNQEVTEDTLRNITQRMSKEKQAADDRIAIERYKTDASLKILGYEVDLHLKTKEESLEEIKRIEKSYHEFAIKELEKVDEELKKLFAKKKELTRLRKPEDVKAIEAEEERIREDQKRKKQQHEEALRELDIRINRDAFLYRKNLISQQSSWELSEAEGKEQHLLDIFKRKLDLEETLTKNAYERFDITASEFYKKRLDDVENLYQKEKESLQNRWNAYLRYYEDIYAISSEDERKQLSRDFWTRFRKYEEDMEESELERKERRTKIFEEMRENTRSLWEEGGVVEVVRKSLRDTSNDFTNFGNQIYSVTQDIANSMVRGFETFFDYTSKNFLNFRNLAISVLNDIYRAMLRSLIIQPFVGAIAGGIARMINPSTPSTVAMDYETGIGYTLSKTYVAVPTKHSGGFVGDFRLVPKFHVGGLSYDEVPAILQKGEYVVSKKGVEFLDRINSASLSTADVNVNVIVNNKTPNQLDVKYNTQTVNLREQVVSIVIDALDRNVLGIRNRLGG